MEDDVLVPITSLLVTDDADAYASSFLSPSSIGNTSYRGVDEGMSVLIAYKEHASGAPEFGVMGTTHRSTATHLHSWFALKAFLWLSASHRAMVGSVMLEVHDITSGSPIADRTFAKYSLKETARRDNYDLVQEPLRRGLDTSRTRFDFIDVDSELSQFNPRMTRLSDNPSTALMLLTRL